MRMGNEALDRALIECVGEKAQRSRENTQGLRQIPNESNFNRAQHEFSACR
jgi:hypothetical protein